MATALAEAHIQAQERLRQVVATMLATVWDGLPEYRDAQIDEWLARALPLVASAKITSRALTEAYIARVLGRQPLGIEFEDPRGVPPEVVYRRPFVTLWTALSEGKNIEIAVREGLANVGQLADTDVQLAMTHTLRAAGEADDLILGYQRVPDQGACKFCKLVAGQRYHTAQLMPIHPHCGCGVEVITGAERPDFTGKLSNDQVSVREHGELGPVLQDPDHHFEAL